MVVQFGELDFTNTPNRTAALRDDRPGGDGVARHQGPERPHDRVGVRHEPDRRPLDDRPQEDAVHPGRGRPLQAVRSRRSPLDDELWAPGAARRRTNLVAELAAAEHRRRGRHDRRRPTHATSARSATTPRSSGTSRASTTSSRHIFDPLDRAEPRGLDRRTGAAAAARALDRLRRGVPARAVPLRAAGVAGAPGQGDLGPLLRRARTRLHVLRDHDDPAAGAVPRLSDLFADRDAGVDPRVHRLGALSSKRFATGRSSCRSCSARSR